jgi:hypothetical protein
MNALIVMMAAILAMIKSVVICQAELVPGPDME